MVALAGLPLTPRCQMLLSSDNLVVFLHLEMIMHHHPLISSWSSQKLLSVTLILKGLN